MGIGRTVARITTRLVVLAATSVWVACGSSDEGDGAAAATGGPGPGCHGDEAAFAQAVGPAACAKHSDCCVVYNKCTNEGRLVHSEQRDEAEASWPYCDSDCTLCEPVAMDLFCLDGQCVGATSETADTVNHCGFDGDPDPQIDTPVSQVACGK